MHSRTAALFAALALGAMLGVGVTYAAFNDYAETAPAPSAGPRPIVTGYGVGSILKREKDYFTEVKCNGCKIECYENVVVVHIDREKEPTWTANYIKPIPWRQIENITLRATPEE